MDRRITILFVVFVTIFVVILNFKKKDSVQVTPVQILFPTDILIEGPSLLDPGNTQSIYEYYLLENLSCGLVRDSLTSASGYEGCLAKNFFQPNPNEWVFELKELQWSDGTQISEKEIRAWIEGVHKIAKRHVQFLKHLTGFSYNHSTKTLVLKFPFAVDLNVIHELSLADAGLFPTNYEVDGWARTVGPYSVRSWSKSERKLILTANRLSPLHNEIMPREALLYPLNNLEDRKNIFKTIMYDVVLLDAAVSPLKSKVLLQNTPQVFEAFPTTIIYFYLNSKNAHAKKTQIRKAFFKAVSEFRGDVEMLTKGSSPFLPETQFIPDGFHGRLNNQIEVTPSKLFERTSIALRIPEAFFSYPAFVETLQTKLATIGFDAEIVVNDGSAINEKDFAILTSFVGNQADSSGSWSFLAGPPHGNLSSFYTEYKAEFEKAFNPQNTSNRTGNLDELHKVVLEKAVGVPLMIGRQRYLLSNRVDASRWNKFDARLRIYELRWK